jgi:hypothetical protein
LIARRARLDALLDVPWELVAYERWLATQSGDREDYLFAEARVRFEAADEDVMVGPADLVLTPRRNELELSSKALGGGVNLRGPSAKQLERVLPLFDGQRTLAEIRAKSGRDRPALEQLVSQALGRVLFVPEAVSGLEAALPGTEIVRFPGTPYEVVRNYWRNMAGVRREAEASLALFAESPLTWLRSLHVVLLLGAELSTFYRPASRISQSGVRPGALYDTPSRRLRSENSSLLLSGPRVGVGFVGGERYHRLLVMRAGDPDSLLPEREVRDANGVDWGAVVSGRSVDEEHDGAWFCPPRPLTEAHFERLFSAYGAALAASQNHDEPTALRELSRFHYRFVRLHPFRCANQSLAMNLVNLVLTRLRGAGMPHLLLDQLALRLSESAYERVFELAANEYAVRGEPVERWRVQRDKKNQAYALIEALKQSATAEAAAALAAADAVAARAALILDSF